MIRKLFLILIIFTLEFIGAVSAFSSESTDGGITILGGVSVPSDFPRFIPSISAQGIAEGRIFITHYRKRLSFKLKIT